MKHAEKLDYVLNQLYEEGPYSFQEIGEVLQGIRRDPLRRSSLFWDLSRSHYMP